MTNSFKHTDTEEEQETSLSYKAGIFLGGSITIACFIALEALVASFILTSLIGLSVSYLQVLGFCFLVEIIIGRAKSPV